MTGNTTGWVDAGWSKFVSTTSQEDWVPAHSAGEVLGNTWEKAIPGVAWVNYTPRPPHPHECPHCRRDRHDGPLTVRVAEMFDSHRFDPGYDPELDSSPVLCVGSDFEGPPTAAAQQVYTYGSPPWAIIQAGVSHLSVYEKLIEMWQWPKFEFASEATWYPEEILDVQCETPDVEVDWDWQDWTVETHKPPPLDGEIGNALFFKAKNAVLKSVDFPVPESKADYKTLADKLNKKLERPKGKK